MVTRVGDAGGVRRPVSSSGSSTTSSPSTYDPNALFSPYYLPYDPALANAYGGSGTGALLVPKPPATAAIEYNVGMVREAYFSSNAGFNKELGHVSGHEPVNIGSEPKNLFETAGGHKGMLVVYVDPDGEYSIDGTPPKFANGTVKRYGFQFHYNPEAIDMVWAGIPNTDVNLEKLGQEKFNLAGANVTQSTISFQMFINRKHDFKYYKPDGTLHPQAPRDLYANRQPRDAAEQKEIYKKGTMYDIEYLASTLLGFKLNSAMRGTTADIGYLTARQVELHLGKSLRYRGILNGFTVNHTHFNENMTPLLSKLTLQFNRYPDYAK